MQRSIDRPDRGFTLIELLVVIVIIGVLAGIAIPSFLSQRDKAAEAGQKSDARSVATQMETYFVDAQRYPVPPELTWSPGTRSVVFGTTGQSVRLSANNQAHIVRNVTDLSYCVEIRNTTTTATAVYDSAAGGLQPVAAGAVCPASYDTTVLAFPAG
jgi:prepilin-type N-terminal cleavage/methylation domain-containing protein